MPSASASSATAVASWYLVVSPLGASTVNSHFCPFFSYMPSLPLLHPAASRICAAFSVCPSSYDGGFPHSRFVVKPSAGFPIPFSALSIIFCRSMPMESASLTALSAVTSLPAFIFCPSFVVYSVSDVTGRLICLTSIVSRFSICMPFTSSSA